LCEAIIEMTQFAELAEMETNGEKITMEQRERLIAMERAAGVI